MKKYKDEINKDFDIGIVYSQIKAKKLLQNGDPHFLHYICMGIVTRPKQES